MDSLMHRPPGYAGKKEHYLKSVARDLEQAITRAFGTFTYKILRLSGTNLEELSAVLVEFAEDLHNDIGIWEAYEMYNIEFFGTPLPFILEPHEDMGSESINRFRIQLLLWVLYSELEPDLLISPTNTDLQKLSVGITEFLARRFKDIPRGSSVKEFLAGPNQFAWQVKRKLVWLGAHSYFFRNNCRNYVADNGGKPDIPVIDDYICQHSTAWSGLGVIDILAAILDISEDQRSALRSWYERHQAFYQIITSNDRYSEVKNLVNDKMYVVRIANGIKPFEIGVFVFGSLIPWNGEWAWSGQQSLLGEAPTQSIQELVKEFKAQCPQIIYRYCNERVKKAAESLAHQHQLFTKNHGNDLVIFPDGLALAADHQKNFRRQWETAPKELVARVMAENKLKIPAPNIKFPPHILNEKNGIGVFHNPDEGEEMMTGFNHIISGFSKKGIDLTRDELDGIRAFVRSDTVSLRFVKRLIQEYGSDSIEAALFIRCKHAESTLDFLLRCYKGTYYRKRYPQISFV